MPLRDVLELGDPALRERSVAVDPSELTDPRFAALITDLIDTMRARDGAGIAAPQIGVLKRVIVVEVRPHNARYAEHPRIPLTVLINPTIELLTDDTFQSFEGCLSVPGLRGLVPRAAGIHLRAVGSNGARISERIWGIRAGVFQHEVDHLDGRLFIDRAGTDAVWPIERFEELHGARYSGHIARIEARYAGAS